MVCSAIAGSFDRVTGVDISQEALENGGIKLERELRDRIVFACSELAKSLVIVSICRISMWKRTYRP